MPPASLARFVRAIVLFAAASCVFACGQSGPLYLPGNPSEVQAPLPGTPASEADEDDDDEEQVERDR